MPLHYSRKKRKCRSYRKREKKYGRISIYKNKYKYRRFTKKIKNNLIGGVKSKAEIIFKTNFNKIKDQLLIEKDFFFKELIKTTQFDENLNLPIDESKNVNEKDALLNKELSGLFTVILNKLIDITKETYLTNKKSINFINDNIEWIIQSYTDFTFRIDKEDPLSSNLLFKNFPVFLIIYERLNFILTNKNIIFNAIKLKIKEHLDTVDMLTKKEAEIKEMIKNKDILKPFKSLIELQEFINKYKIEIGEIEESLKNTELKAHGKGPENAEVILDTPNLFLYKVLTKSGSLCYGSNTTWCTATTSFFNKYDLYRKTGELYIIQDKSNPNHKYQMHIKTGQLRDEKDKPVSIHEIVKSLNDDVDLSEYFKNLSLTFNSLPLEELYDFRYNDKEASLIIYIRGLYYDFIYSSVKPMDFSVMFTDYLKKKNLEGLKSLVFGNTFNQELGNSLHTLTKLESLTFGTEFNQELGHSLDNLNNLKTLTFGSNFNKQIPESVKYLVV